MKIINELKRSLSNKEICIVATSSVFVAALFFGYFLGAAVQKDKYKDFLRSFKNIRENSDKYTFINPLIGGVSAPATDVGLYTDIRDDVVTYLRNEKMKGELYDYSFYFRDMNTGLWFGANDSTNFFPASLFKLPIAIAVYKQSEDDPSFLQRRLVYSADLEARNEAIKSNSDSVLIIGNSYSVQELVAFMLTASDNGAKNLILTVLDKKYINQLFSIVALIDPYETTAYQISSRKYALFLRILYGASYISEEHSELVLSYLVKSDFKSGMVAGLPSAVMVAHKYGVYEFDEKINGVMTHAQQLHDCGVVYHVQRPYIFCLMTKGKDVKSLLGIISHTSSMIYQSQENDNHEGD